jgi:hypothetical protein
MLENLELGRVAHAWPPRRIAGKRPDVDEPRRRSAGLQKYAHDAERLRHAHNACRDPRTYRISRSSLVQCIHASRNLTAQCALLAEIGRWNSLTRRPRAEVVEAGVARQEWQFGFGERAEDCSGHSVNRDATADAGVCGDAVGGRATRSARPAPSDGTCICL